MTDIVLWNAKEAVKRCEEFVKSYAQIRSDLLDHYDHKGHVALRYTDDWAGFHAYCAERLKLDSKLDTIKLQISTAKVSREVGVEVPMVISRQLAKLPPDQQKGVYDEVIGAREKAGQRSANQMEPDVRRVVRRVMGVEEKPEKEPVSTTDTAEEVAEALTNSLGPGTKVYVVEDDVPKIAFGVDMGTDQGTAAQLWVDGVLQKETVNQPADAPLNYRKVYDEARELLCRFSAAISSGCRDEDILPVYTDTCNFLKKH